MKKKKIEFYKLGDFSRLHDEMSRLFYGPLTQSDPAVRLEAREKSIEFLRNNGFRVDDKLEWVHWDNDKDYLLSVLKWS